MASSPPMTEGASQPASKLDVPPVIIACAQADASVVDDAARALTERGHRVELALGADAEPQALTAAVQRVDRQGLYVLCRSAALERAAVDRLRALLRKEGIPFGRTLTLALDSGAAAARGLEDRIVSVTRRMVTGRDSGPYPAAQSLLPPPTTRVTKMPQPPPELGEDIDTRVERARARFPTGGSKPIDEPIRESDVDAWADSLAGKQIISPLPDFDSTSHTAQQSFGASLPVGSSNDSAPASSLSLAAPDGDDFAPSGVDRTQVNRSPSVLPFAPARPSVPEASAPAFAAGPPADGGVPSSHSSGALEPFETTNTRGAWLMVGGGLVAVVLIGLLAWAFGGDRSDSDEDPDRVASADAVAPREGSTPQEKVPEASEPNTEASSRTANEASAEAADVSEASSDRDDDTHDAAQTPPSRAAVPQADDSPLVTAALQSRQVRALDTLLVPAEPSSTRTFASAETYCTKLEIAGLKGWRLPSIGELNSLASAKLFAKGVLWSHTLGDAFGDQRLVYNLRKRAIAAVSATWDGAAALCIRERN